MKKVLVVVALILWIFFGWIMNANASGVEITVNGKLLNNFTQEQLDYIVYVPKGEIEVPIVKVKTLNNSDLSVIPAHCIPGITYVKIGEIGEQGFRVYAINFKETDVDMKAAEVLDLRLGGETIDGFSPEKEEYTVMLDEELPVLPIVTVTPKNESVIVTDKQADRVGSATIIIVNDEKNYAIKIYKVKFRLKKIMQ